MGCDIHCVMQKLNTNTQDWETIDKDIFGRNYELFNFLSGVRGLGRGKGIATNGFPVDFYTIVDTNGDTRHDGYWMGEHNYGHCSLEDFINKKVSRYATTVKILQRAFMFMYWQPTHYRLVFGYDS